MNKPLLLLISIFVIAVGISCAYAADSHGAVDGDAGNLATHDMGVKKINDPIPVKVTSDQKTVEKATENQIESKDIENLKNNENPIEQNNTITVSNDKIINEQNSTVTIYNNKPVTGLNDTVTVHNDKPVTGLNDTVTVHNDKNAIKLTTPEKTNDNPVKLDKIELIDTVSKEVKVTPEKIKALQSEINRYYKFYMYKIAPPVWYFIKHFKEVNRNYSSESLIKRIYATHSFEDTVIIATEALHKGRTLMNYQRAENVIRKIQNSEYYNSKKTIDEHREEVNKEIIKYSEYFNRRQGKEVVKGSGIPYIYLDLILDVYKYHDKDTAVTIAYYALKNNGINIDRCGVENSIEIMKNGQVKSKLEHKGKPYYSGWIKSIEHAHSHRYKIEPMNFDA